jgi:DNA polymerase I-like protein with 3'-5' exonuclease and polymerase domains/uracil-DNA glycosylase
MGFLPTSPARNNESLVPKNLSVDFLHRHGCAVCPLNHQRGLKHPHMEPTGSDHPTILVIGEAPGASEDEQGKQFVGKTGQILRFRIPEKWNDKIRWTNVVRCFPGSVKVTTPSRIKKLFRRYFVGELIIVKTRFGDELPCTPHHPILTSQGWLFAYQLSLGDQIVNYGSRNQWMGGIYPHEQNKPSRLDELFAAQSLVGHSQRMVDTNFNFHGDIGTGEVEVVSPNWVLSDKSNASPLKFGNQQQLNIRGNRKCLLKSSSTCLASTNLSEIGPQSNTLTEATFPIDNTGISLCPNTQLFTNISDFNTVPFEKTTYSTRADMINFSEFFRAFTGDVPITDFLNGWRSPQGLSRFNISGLSMGTHSHPIRKEDFLNQELGGSELLFKLTQTNPTLIQFDNVIHIDTQPFEGFIYNLETDEGWYVAENHVVSNTRPPKNREPTQVEVECCRPSITSDVEKTKPKAIFGFGNVPLQWALKQQGITKWNGRHVPIKVGNHICWFFPMMHPSYVGRSRKFEPRDKNSYGSDIEFAFANDLRNAFAIVDKLPEPKVFTVEDLSRDVEIITNPDAAIKFIKAMHNEKIVGYDYETKGLRPYKKTSKILTVAMAGYEVAASFPLYHPECDWSDRQIERVEDTLLEFLLTAPCKKVVHSLSFEMEWSAYFYGRKVLRAQPWEDTLSQAYILDERMGGNPGCHSLEFLCIQYFGLDVKALFGKLDKNNLDKEPLDQVLRYNALDSKAHRYLYFPQRKRLRDEDLMGVYEHQLRRIPTMVLTQLKGIPANQDVVNEFDKEFTQRRSKIEKDLTQLDVVKKFARIKKTEFRPSANQDVKFVIEKILNHPVESVDENELKQIKHPFVNLVLDWREANKMHSTYILPFKKGSDTLYSDGCVHPHISTHSTRTWRTSSNDPNSQNIVKHGPNRKLRKQVKPGGDLRVVTVDFSGIQARNVAMESCDKALVDAFWNNYDIHSDWMYRLAKMYPQWLRGKSLKDKELAKELRQESKNKFVFPSFFGAQAENVSGGLGVPKHIGVKLQETFWSKFPDIKKWHDDLEKMYYKLGYITGLSGFRRRAPISPNQRINSPIQALESKIVCSAMARLSEYEQLRFQANMEIHDDLTFIWPKHEIDKNLEIVVREMTRVEFPWVNVPLGVEVSVGENWCDLTEIGKFSSVEIWGHKRS